MPLIIIGAILGIVGLTCVWFGRRHTHLPESVKRVNIAFGVLAVVLIFAGVLEIALS